MTSSNYPKVSVIILNWNGFENTVECLRSLLKNKYKNFEVILVDNNSAHQEAERLKKLFDKSIKIIQALQNLGFAQGNNLGIQLAFNDPKTRYILLLNNDTVVDKKFLEAIIKTTLKDEKIGMVAPKIIQLSHPSKIDTLGIQLTKSGYGKNALQNKNAICPSGTAGLYSRELLEAIAVDNEYLPAKFFLYYEDLDLGFRGRLAGFKFAYAPRSIVYHKGSATAGKMTDISIFYSQRNVLWFTLRCFPNWLLLIDLPWIILAQLGAIVLYAFKYRRPRIILKAKLASFKGILNAFKQRQEIQIRNKLPWKACFSLISSDLF